MNAPDSSQPVEQYLGDLARELRKRGVLESRFMEETRGHLTDAIEAGQRRGLAPSVAEQEAVQRFGEPRTVAAKFAAEKFRGLHAGLLVGALVLGLAIARMDALPHWDDSGITAGCLLLSAAALGLIGPRKPWLWALAIGIWIPLHLIVSHLAAGSFTLETASYLAILAFPMAGAYAGMGLRKLFAAA
ncbi:MAG TPA: permease prefix domain 1-containing protein [Acidobacteriaceae bacterium]|jgi:hypothetical protein|nr:permease prefix domain 1-containing protein [Acidobacteriaceae bacterium]